ncbi:tumor necrosis factor receptor superfamily member 21 isoform X2 [Rhinatrema bivittatum]|uniref:tumor necrosis factor receptor superfamily member 21 isoform X2 n=1 Tax=Rhinatrema bivittatum TaxID=194408 RepID=UPI00112A583A|nr:tumor necrosis factor receptor superfamily member 21 isoform X2 [Rhinatrema bivittatum]
MGSPGIGACSCRRSALLALDAGGTRAAMLGSFLTVLVLIVPADAKSEQASQNLPSVKYRHTDRTTNKELLCDKCPAGTYVSKHCKENTLRECSPCSPGTFTKHENGIDRCHVCREPCQRPMVERAPCTALSDRECSCPPGNFLSNDICTPHTLCPAGWGVKKKGSETEDARCKQCLRGTFSDVPSSVMRCKSHTDCLGLGLVLITPGTRESDNVCGVFSSFSGTGTVSTEPLEESGNRTALPTSPPKGVTSSGLHFAASTGLPRIFNATSRNETNEINMTVPSPRATKHQQNHHHKKHTQVTAVKTQPAMGLTGGEGAKTAAFKPTRRGPPRQNVHKHFDINEHLPWMTVLFLLLVLVVIVVCSIRRSSRVLKKGPRQDPSTIVEKAAMKKPTALTQNREKWVYYCNGHGIDILKLVAAQVGSQWQDIYQLLCNPSEREVAAFSIGYSADHERAYAALQQWTIRGPEASLALLISALRQHRRNDVVEKIRGLMEDTVQEQSARLLEKILNHGPEYNYFPSV